MGSIAEIRREESDRVISPVVGQAFVDEVLVCDKGVHWEQFDCGDTQPLEIFDDRPRRQTGISAAQRLMNQGVFDGETPHVYLVNDCLAPGAAQRSIVSPGKSLFNDD